MKSSFTVFASIAALATLAGCTSLQSVSITQIPSDRSRPLHAEVSNTALLGIHFSNDFIEPLTGDLMRQCPRGRVTGILTKQESSVYVIVQVRRVVATGYCVYDAPPAQPSEATAMQVTP
jgi:hypothetical protein